MIFILAPVLGDQPRHFSLEFTNTSSNMHHQPSDNSYVQSYSYLILLSSSMTSPLTL